MNGKMMLKRVIVSVFLCLLIPAVSFAIPPMPCKIGGTVTVNGAQMTQAKDSGYTFTVTRSDGTDFIDASGNPAKDTDGLNASNYYIIDIPIFHEKDQPGGAKTGDSTVIHVYKDGGEMAVTSPANGKITVGESGTVQIINIEFKANNWFIRLKRAVFGG
jgi:hypothetical protein